MRGLSFCLAFMIALTIALQPSQANGGQLKTHEIFSS